MNQPVTDPLQAYKAALARFEHGCATEDEYVAAGDELLRSARALFGSSATLAEVKSMVNAAEMARAVADRPQRTLEALAEFGDAVRDFFDVVAKRLRLEQFATWLARKLSRGADGSER